VVAAGTELGIRLGIGLGIQPGLEDQDGGDLIDDGFMGGGWQAGGGKVAMGFSGGEALVPEVDGDGSFGLVSILQGIF